MERIAVVGAGLSGLAAAFKLRQQRVEVCLFEKSRGLSGRAASRSRNGCRYDYGANYFKLNCDEVARLLFEDLPTGELCRIVGDVRPFDADGTIFPADPELNAGAKWSYQGGISTLGKLMVEVGGLDVRRETTISRLVHSSAGWSLIDDQRKSHGPFDVLLLTPPAPQTITLLRSAEIDRDPMDSLIEELGQASYHSQFSVALNFAGSLDLPGNAYALINADREHEVAWLSHENKKAGHVPAGETLLIAQMSPAWSQDHYHDPADEIIEAALRSTARLLSTTLPPFRWGDTQRWRYAHPYCAASLEAMKPGADLGLFFAGDAFIGKGRIPRAIETGFAAARQIAGHLRLK